MARRGRSIGEIREYRLVTRINKKEVSSGFTWLNAPLNDLFKSAVGVHLDELSLDRLLDHLCIMKSTDNMRPKRLRRRRGRTTELLKPRDVEMMKSNEAMLRRLINQVVEIEKPTGQLAKLSRLKGRQVKAIRGQTNGRSTEPSRLKSQQFQVERGQDEQLRLNDQVLKLKEVEMMKLNEALLRLNDDDTDETDQPRCQD
ncbi:hypothetical protein V8G54_021560 [Vigna mungo]|uniref:Uncharacterized protein n=1 Tax=Vigna mungo TaxID=3915 RepID=A0AAQ3RUE6_VIGMU